MEKTRLPRSSVAGSEPSCAYRVGTSEAIDARLPETELRGLRRVSNFRLLLVIQFSNVLMCILFGRRATHVSVSSRKLTELAVSSTAVSRSSPERLRFNAALELDFV
ncbi:hypothetical protein PENSPDRAFT_337365 [Peniophora sp. CONT]|nr:hypothetical protein PENSPDRAFT_337365 [Peniophora sp. CONT]